MSTALARQGAQPIGLQDWQLMREQAGVLLASGFLPGHIKSPEAAITIMLKGRELDIPPLYALSNISVVNGKPTCGAELMMALVKRDLGRDAIRVIETTADHCTVEYQDGSHVGTFTFGADDAKKAGLWGKAGPWTQYPAAMLRARCISAACRFVFPDVIGGLYTPEELGAEVAVDEHGAMEVLALPAPETKPSPPGDRAVSSLPSTAEVATPRAPMSAPAGGDYREPTEDEWIVWDDKVREQTGYSHADVCALLGRSPADHLRVLNADGTAKTGKALIADLIAYKREGRTIPGVAVSAAVQHLQSDILPPPATTANGSDVLGCQVCGNELEETKFRDGTSWTPAKLAEFGRKKHDMVLCMVHYREMNAAKTGTSAPLAEATAR